MTSVLSVVAPSGSGPSERDEALRRARAHLADQGVAPEDVVRVDVPSGAGEGATLRADVEPMVPVLQSASLFGGRQGLLLADVQNLTAAEAEVLADLLTGLDPEAVAVALVSVGKPKAVVVRAVEQVGTSVTIRRIQERDVPKRLVELAAERGLELGPEAQAALIQRFGTDLGSLEGALDQLAEAGGRITRAEILRRFKNRPDEPMWHYTDAVAAGRVDEALRRLGDLFVHTHPLQILAALENDLRRRALASSAPDLETFRQAIGARPSDRRPEHLWRARGRVKDSSLRRALGALTRADKVLKSAPEELHRVTMERLTVALARWYSGR